MNDSERPKDNPPTERLQLSRLTRDKGTRARTRTNVEMQPPLSAHAAAAQFDLASILETPHATSRDRALLAPGQRASTEVTTRSATGRRAGMDKAGDADKARETGRLPSAWYKQADEIAEAARKERTALIIRGGAAACLLTGGALLFWLGAFGGKSLSDQRTTTAAVTSVRLPPMASTLGPIIPTPPPVVERNARALVTTAQILAVAERFIAEGDVLAARAILSDTAANGDARALFALAETYDPNLLASWNAQKVEASPAYARLLYEAAMRAGMPDAQFRLDAIR